MVRLWTFDQTLQFQSVSTTEHEMDAIAAILEFLNGRQIIESA